MSLTRKWSDRSFFIELKPRTDQASLFLDFSPEDNFDGAILDMGINYIEYGEPVANCENVLPGVKVVEPDSFRVDFEGLELTPTTFSGGTWTQMKQRLFMCKLKAHSVPALAYKTNHQLAEKALSVEPLKEFCAMAEDKHIGLACAVCGSNFLGGEENKNRKLTVGWVPSDDWMTMTPAVDYYCRDTCGAGCDPNKHGTHRPGVESEDMHDEWKPTKLRIMISHTTLFVRKEIIKDAIKIDTNLVACSNCDQHLGQRVRGNNKNILQLHHSNVSLLCDRQKYLNIIFPDRSTWFSQQLLLHFESAASQKLVVRSLDKKPYLLVWILDSYVAIVNGELKPSQEPNVSRPRPALKMLYKLFDSDNACHDPRANGEDSSVGILDIPLLACEDLKEALLRSSLAIPVSLRAGALGPHLIKAHLAVRPSVKKVIIWNRTEERAKKLADEMRENAGLDGVCFESSANLDDAISVADIVSCATNSEVPLVKGDKLKGGAYLNLVGSFQHSMRECDDMAMKRGRVFVDCEEALEEAGELVGALERGVIEKSDIMGLVDLIKKGEIVGRRNEDEIFVFKSVGSAVFDLVAAQLAYETTT